MKFSGVLAATMAASIGVASHAFAANPAGEPTPLGGADAGLDLPVEGVITRPDWVQLPSGDDMARFYPNLAMTMGLAGHAMLTCKVTSLGMIEGCRVIEETPIGLGFGAAAMQMSPLFRMKPLSVDGAPVGGGVVTVPIRFTIEDDVGSMPTADIHDRSLPDGHSMELARRLVAAIGVSDRAAEAIKLTVQRMREAPEGGSGVDAASKAARDAALESIEQAYLAYIPRYLDRVAVIYARTLSEKDLFDVVAFMESPSGKTWMAHEADLLSTVREEDADYAKVWQEDARRRFCLKVACALPAASRQAPPSAR